MTGAAAVAIAFALLLQAVQSVPATIVGGIIALREVHRDATGARSPRGASVPSPR